MSSSLIGSTGFGGGSSTGSKLRGLDPRMKHIPGHHRYQQFTPEQMNIFEQAQGQVGPQSFLSKLGSGDEEMFNQMEAPALRQFSGIMGNIASRFSGGNPFGGGGGAGAMSARRSSGFQNTMGAAASDFAQQLQANRQGLQRQAIGDLMSYSNMLLGQRPYDAQVAQPSSSSGWGGLVGGLAGGALGATTGNPYWAMQGAQLGYGMGSQF